MVEVLWVTMGIPRKSSSFKSFQLSLALSLLLCALPVTLLP